MSSTSILVVEDEVVVAADLANKLRKLGYEVVGPTDTGEEAIDLARQHLPDVVLMDIYLAGAMDGVMAAEQIRRQLDLPVVFLTAHSDRATLNRAKRSEPYGYIIKPFEIRELETQVEMALHKHQAELRLRASEERYRMLFDRNPDAVFAVGPDGRFLAVNPACETISGYSGQELLAMTFLALCLPDRLDKTLASFEAALHQRRRQELETALVRKDGRRVEVWVTGEPIVVNDQVVSMHCTARDITERKQEEEARQFLIRCGTGGEDFFRDLARYLAHSLEMDFVCVGRLQADASDAITEVIYRDGTFEAHIPCGLGGTPCGDLVANQVRCFATDVRHQFPDGLSLHGLGAESYASATLWGAQGQPIGQITLISRRPMANPRLVESILQMSSVRAAGELERRQAEEALRASETYLRRANDELEFWVEQRTMELKRTNQALRTLSACNEAMVRMEDEQALMQEICRIAVEIGGYRMAWVGMAEADADRNVRPVAYTGIEEGYLKMAPITWADNERGHGPTGVAIRSGQVQIAKDFRTDPRLAPWRAEALRRGYRSSIALPLHQRGTVIGAFTIYSAEINFFGEAQIKALSELADNLAFGLGSLRTRAELRQSRDRLRALAGELTLAEQRERRRLAAVLHDHLQQLLVGAKFRSVVLGRSTEPTVKRVAGEIEDLLDQSIAASRSLTAELNPPLQQAGGLTMGLVWLARWMADKHGLQVELALEREVASLADEVKVLLFESVRELLFNVVKHAGTQSAKVSMQEATDGRLRIVVADNGVGYDPPPSRSTMASNGFGLFSIRERLDLIGARLEIESSSGQGSRCTILTPLAPTAG